MNWVDVLIVAIVIVAAIRGWFSGAIRQVLGWIGLIAGFYIGIAIAPSLSTRITHAAWRPLLALGIVLVIAYLGHFGGHVLGSFIRQTVKMVKLGLIDSVAGVAVGVVGALITVWLVAALLVSTSWSAAAEGIQGSRIIKGLDSALPTVPSAEARLQTLLHNANFPSVFTSIVAPTIPSSGKTPRLGPNIVVATVAGAGSEGPRDGLCRHPSGNGILRRARCAGHERTRRSGRHECHRQWRARARSPSSIR